MIVNPSYFRKIGRDMLKEDWQTPLWVTFLADLFLSAVSTLYRFVTVRFLDGTPDLITSIASSSSAGNLEDITRFMEGLKLKLAANLNAIPAGIWIAFGAAIVMMLVLTPVLKLSEHHYYLRRHAGKTVPLSEGVLWGFPKFGKAWGLYALMVLKVLLWALIAIPVAGLVTLLGGMGVFGIFLLYLSLIPALLALLRYLFAPYVMAEKPEMGVRACIDRSKEITAKRKSVIFAVGLGFVLYQLVLSLVLSLLQSIGLPNAVVMVVSLLGSLILSVYSISTFTGVYLVMAYPEMEQAMNRFLRAMMQSRGMDQDVIDRMMKENRHGFDLKKDDDKTEDEEEEDDDNADSHDEWLN